MNPSPKPCPGEIAGWTRMGPDRHEKKAGAVQLVLQRGPQVNGKPATWLSWAFLERRGGGGMLFVIEAKQDGFPTAEQAGDAAEWAARKILRMDLEGDA